MEIAKKGHYLAQFISREVINDLFERIYSDFKDINGNLKNIGLGVFSRGKIELGKKSFIGQETVLNGKIKVGSNTYIAPRATIYGNLSIGSNCYIEAGTVVDKSIPANSYVFGNPCVIKKMNESFVPKNFISIREPQKKPVKDISNFFKLTCKIGKNVKFGKQVHLEGGGKIAFGDNSSIGNRCIFISTQHPHSEKEDLIDCEQHWFDIKVGKKVVIEDNCIIRGGVTIGNNAKIKAGSVVTKSIKANSIVRGCPAKPHSGKLENVTVKFPHIANVWAVTGHMYPAVAYFNCFKNISIEYTALVNNELMIIGNKKVKIERKSLIGPRVVLITETPLSKGNITIEKYSHIGAGTVILPGVKILRGAIIGAGSVVNRNVGKNEIWVGNIAKRINNRYY